MFSSGKLVLIIDSSAPRLCRQSHPMDCWQLPCVFYYHLGPLSCGMSAKISIPIHALQLTHPQRKIYSCCCVIHPLGESSVVDLNHKGSNPLICAFVSCSASASPRSRSEAVRVTQLCAGHEMILIGDLGFVKWPATTPTSPRP